MLIGMQDIAIMLINEIGYACHDTLSVWATE
jgi:hypothetical protein